LSMKK